MAKKRLSRNQGIWFIIISGILALLPDPTDLLDAGTPLLELISILIISFITNFKNNGK